MKYQVQIKTADQVNAGTNSKIQLKIIGSEGETKFCTLDHLFYDDFKSGAIDSYTITGDDVGEVECISIFVKTSAIDKSCNWYIDYIIVHKDPPIGEAVTFPVYQWINKSDHHREFIISTNKTCIPQKESLIRLKDDRRAQQTKKVVIRWRPNRHEEGLPGHIDVYGGHDNIPDFNVKFTDEKSRDFTKNARKARNNGLWLGLLSKIQSFQSFDDFKHFSRDLKQKKHPPWILDDKWKKDEEFGRQILNGINPAHVRRCRTLPDNFPVTDEHTTGVLTRGKGLQEEMDMGNIYIINHEILKNIPTGQYNEKSIQLAAPMCLFYVRDDDEFLPIAIQLGQNKYDPYFPIWTPKDEPLDWLLAKMWFRNADFQVHQMSSHLAYTHFLMEPFAVAMYRCLPPVHPIHKLLREHLQYVIAINTLGRASLIQKDGPADSTLSIGHGSNGIVELLQKSFDGFDFDNEFNFPNNIQNRDVADIPNYHFRDDGLALWDAIRNYVEAVINIFYQTDEDVQEDHELQDWNTELHVEGFSNLGIPGNQSNAYKAERNLLHTKEELTTLCTIVIFASAVKHAAVNFEQWEYGSFAPNCPSTMRGNLPTEDDRGNITMKFVMDSLPGPKLCIRSAGIAFILSEFSEDEVFLLLQGSNKNKRRNSNLESLRIHGRKLKSQFSLQPRARVTAIDDSDLEGLQRLSLTSTLFPPRWLFNEQEVKTAFLTFQHKLRRIEEQIEERNKNLTIPYTVLLPSRIPSGIAI